ncbi:unnamed protein product [Blepharisma stoltei]|uniref:Histidine kinase n=1 Tax=Blepharisma stoltei TaxID=1481888 RepID=A0AAU9JK32_9CILI|nr:unnamed protein product [Blepharisma stoltei]
MEKLHRIWWQEEVIEKYKVLQKFLYSRLLLVVSFWVVLWVAQIAVPIKWLRLESIHFVYGISQLATCFLVKLVENKEERWKSILAVILAECNCIGWWVMGLYGYKSSRVLLSNLSLTCINICEWPFIHASWLRILILCKHLLLWHYIGYYYGEIENTGDTMPHLMAFMIIILCDNHCSLQRKNSFERFISRKNLENAEKRLSVIFNLFPDGFLILSKEKLILYSNQILTTLLLCNLNQVIQKLTSIEYSQDKKYSHLSNSNKLIDDINLVHNLQINQQVILGLSQSQNMNLEWKAQKILWDEGEEATLLIVANANHIIELEQTISDNKLKNVLLRSVSHELRTPLNAIISLSNSLSNEREIAINKEMNTKLNIISVSSKLLLSLVNDLLDYSRFLAGAFSIQKSMFLIRNAIYEAVQLVKLQADQKKLKIFVRIDPNIPDSCYSDSLRLSQILLNLLSNALKFTFEGYIEVCCLLNSTGKVQIIVNDTGIGIENSRMSNIFKEFNTLTNPIINPSGCGLGLFISNLIAKELGNEPIKVQSAPGKGSSFCFFVDIFEENPSIENANFEELPEYLVPEEAPSIKIKDFNEYIEKEYPKVLIVDDNDFNRIALGDLLRHYGILYDESCTGKQAVKKVEEANGKNKPYKVVVMDGSMPELNGWDATKLIYQLFYEGKILILPSIIGYTAFTSEMDISLCINAGMKECLIKPCNPGVLIEKVSKYLSL